jgi:hypothetical protein
MRAASLGETQGPGGRPLSRKLVLCGLLILTGCGLSRHARETAGENKVPVITKQNNEAIDQCQKLYPDPHRKPALPRIKCFNDATLAYYAAFADNPWSDLAREFTARMVVIAKKYDVGQISETQFDVEKAQAVAKYTSQVIQRENNAAVLNAAPTQASAASKQTLATVLPKQMTCVQTFNSVTCY